MFRNKLPTLLFCCLLAACATHASPEEREKANTLSDQGKTLLAAGQADEARDAYLSAVFHDDRNARAWNGLGVAYDLSDHDDKAQEAYQRAIDLEPHELGAVNNLAHLYMEQGNPAAAVELLQPYAEDFSTPVTLRQNLAEAVKATQTQATQESGAFADLGSFPTEGMAKGRVAQARNLLEENAEGLSFEIAPEVKIMGGTPVFTIKATGKDPQTICEALSEQAIPCVPSAP